MNHTLSAYSLFLRNSFTGFCHRRLQEDGISQGLLYFILYVGRHPDCTLGELSEALGADGGYTTRSVEKLIKGGFMEKRRSRSDRRFSHLRLTGRGEDMFRLAHSLFGQWDEAAMACLSCRERETLLSLLGRVAGNLEPEPGKFSSGGRAV